MITAGSSIAAMSVKGPLHCGQVVMSMANGTVLDSDWFLGVAPLYYAKYLVSRPIGDTSLLK
ncbi:MAG: hypothetical protein O6918_06860 [Deltaproteobacteria bacterium]|nr:hypothetical protein [Deltaproteobacteria bacterium]